MVRRVRGDASVARWEGSADQRAARAAIRDRHEQSLRVRAARLAAADFTGPGTDTPAVRRLAELNAESMSDLGEIAERLNREGLTDEGTAWTGQAVAARVAQLWPYSAASGWDPSNGTYPGYLGGLRDSPVFETLGGRDDRVGRTVNQITCVRCRAEWPAGWPGTQGLNEVGQPAVICPDCGGPHISYGAAARAHSVIDLHWMLYRHAPLDPGPCPVCAAPRQLFACGHPDTARRILTWHCPSRESSLLDRPPLLPHEDDPWTAHHAAASAPVEWVHPADADAYWLARDLLRVVVAAGEVSDLPEGAIYDSLDGADERWIYRGAGAGWEPSTR